jgi:hypothetical protein
VIVRVSVKGLTLHPPELESCEGEKESESESVVSESASETY